MIEAQERHEKSPKKMTSTHARCGSSGGLFIYASEEEKRYYQLLNIYLSTNTNKEVFHIQMSPINAYGWRCGNLAG